MRLWKRGSERSPLEDDRRLRRMLLDLYLAPDTPSLIRLVAGDRSFLSLSKALLHPESPTETEVLTRASRILAREQRDINRLKARLQPVACAIGMADSQAAGPLDYYAILGVGRDAGQAEIKKAYRKKARKLHPDAQPHGARGSGAFVELNTAYQTLSDDASRRQYDLTRNECDGTWYENANPVQNDAASPGNGHGTRAQRIFVFLGALALFLLAVALVLDAEYRERALFVSDAPAPSPPGAPNRAEPSRATEKERSGSQATRDPLESLIPPRALPRLSELSLEKKNPDQGPKEPGPRFKGPRGPAPAGQPAPFRSASRRNDLPEAPTGHPPEYFAKPVKQEPAPGKQGALPGLPDPVWAPVRDLLEMQSPPRESPRPEPSPEKAKPRGPGSKLPIMAREDAKLIPEPLRKGARPPRPLYVPPGRTALAKASEPTADAQEKPAEALDGTPPAKGGPAANERGVKVPPFERIREFLDGYERAYKSRNIQAFKALFSPDATENGRPFREVFPLYRERFEALSSIRYRIDPERFVPSAGKVAVKGRFSLAVRERSGEWAAGEGRITLGLVEKEEGFLVERLEYQYEDTP